VSLVLISVAYSVFDLTTWNSDVLERSIVERMQCLDQCPLPLLAAHPRAEPDKSRRDRCDPGSRTCSRCFTLSEVTIRSRVVVKVRSHFRLKRYFSLMRMRRSPPALLVLRQRASVDGLARFDKARV
jgi:hypothetical protein